MIRVLLTALLMLCSTASAQEHAVVVSADVQLESVVKTDARKLFTGQSSTWTDGRPVNLVLPPIESEAMAWLSSQVLGLPPDIYYRYLLERAYRVGKPPPRISSSVDEIRALSGTEQGVLTVLPSPTGEGFRVVRIN